jgi:hypothetical protein
MDGFRVNTTMLSETRSESLFFLLLHDKTRGKTKTYV